MTLALVTVAAFSPSLCLGRDTNVLSAISACVCSELSSLLGSMQSGKELLIAFLSLTIRCGIKSIALHLKSLARLGLQKGLGQPAPGTATLCTVAHICPLNRAGKHPGARGCPHKHSVLKRWSGEKPILGLGH